jgi:hypothetical protein
MASVADGEFALKTMPPVVNVEAWMVTLPPL